MMTAHDTSSQYAPTIATSATQPQPVATDLGTLVDRLIAARQASHASQVGAHIAHADFGRIDLSFAADAGGLTVGMRSHDPDFAPSVQAAASAVAPPAPATDSRAAQDSAFQQSSSNATSTASQGSPREQARPGAQQTAQETAQARQSGASATRPSVAARREDPRGVYA